MYRHASGSAADEDCNGSRAEESEVCKDKRPAGEMQQKGTRDHKKVLASSFLYFESHSWLRHRLTQTIVFRDLFDKLIFL